ncbi:hypothetical protein POSPLADRAFT_1062765 [Postia placenta MAD-698-R-SB12]|uniref:Fungal-type protein kinase domain-containing protein n=1 Tax=Postia placenta MAD-698-R-SB12 TaxID=670580 RepID=A0A1X6MJ63_9APHY|nr:hypothetical protein POSPLADRAFT_1062765 [Postia placenta MAD-698-R-SB12]OSX56276.1 hypothetical protein POSPLADRAFT_1062765 [Postia placenta MAD-698-R-SB12]
MASSRKKSKATPARTAGAPRTPPRSPKSTAARLEEIVVSTGSTPASAKVSAQVTHAVLGTEGKDLRKKYQQRLNNEMVGHWVQVKKRDFMTDHVPGDEPSEEELAELKSVCFDKKVFKGNDESKMYTIFCKGAKKALDLCPESGDKLVAKNTSRYPDQNNDDEGGKHRPDVVLYPAEKTVQDRYTFTTKELKKIAAKEKQAREKAHGGHTSTQQELSRLDAEERKKYLARTAWGWASLIVEFKAANSDGHPFSTSVSPDKWLPNTELSAETRGQIADYAATVLRYQPRCFCFMIVISGCSARLLRWDRCGAIVSEPFDFVEDPELLMTFLYKYGRMSQAQRGYDPTVQEATPAEIKTMKDWKKKAVKTKRMSKYHAQCFEAAMGEAWPIYKVIVPKEDVVCDASLRPKDAGDLEKSHQEHEIYIRLWQNGVRYIARPVSGGDVRSSRDSDDSVQRTLTQKYIKAADPKSEAVGRVHYRLICDQVYRPLETYKNGFEMTEVLCYAILAHRDAWEKADVLHRDISVGNILLEDYIDEEGNPQVRGILNDWDMAKLRAELGGKPTQASRSGTWQFMSALLLMYPDQKQHELADDMESFVHLTNWLVLKWHKHKLTGKMALLSHHINVVYDAYSKYDKFDVGGDSKLEKMRSKDVPFKPVASPVLQKLTKDLAKFCYEHHDAVKLEVERMEQGREEIQVSPHQTSSVNSVGRYKNPFASEPGVYLEEYVALVEADQAPEPSKRVMDDHAHLFTIFQRALLKHSDSRLEPDKTQDQFKPFADPFTGAQTRYGSMKRGPDHDTEDEGPSSKRAKGSAKNA